MRGTQAVVIADLEKKVRARLPQFAHRDLDRLLRLVREDACAQMGDADGEGAGAVATGAAAADESAGG